MVPSRNGGALIAIVLAVIGAVFQAWGFVNGISAALDAGGSGAGPLRHRLLRRVCASFLLRSLSRIVGLVRRRAKGLWIVALLISLLPVGAVIAVAVAARFSI